MQKDLAIIIPAYNEAKTIASVIGSASTYGDVIVVDDCSTDATLRISLQSPATKIIPNKKNRGYDATLNEGFESASKEGYQYAITVDADGQHDIDLIPQYAALLRNGYDVVLGARPNTARISEALFAFYTRHRYGIYDPLCGMKGYNMAIYEELGHFDSYDSIGTELMMYALNKRKRYKQIDINITERDGKPQFGSTLTANIRILRALVLSVFKFR